MRSLFIVAIAAALASGCVSYHDRHHHSKRPKEKVVVVQPRPAPKKVVVQPRPAPKKVVVARPKPAPKKVVVVQPKTSPKHHHSKK